MKYLIIALIVCPIIITSNNIFAQDWKASIDEVYQKEDSRTFGDIYSWIFNKKIFNKSYAMVIGIGDYTNGWSTLDAPYHDARRVRDFLINDEGFDYVVTITNNKATKNKINILMEETFPDLLKENDRFLFYFSGHGTQRIVGESVFGYLVLQKCGLDSYADMITMEDIERWDRLLYQSRHVMFVLDCCFSGLAGQQRKSPLTDKKIDRLSQYAHHLITAGTANEESVASLRIWHGSLFTDSFLKAVSGRADLSSSDYGVDGVVCLKELIKYIGDRIDDESVKRKSKNPFSKGIKMSPQISDLQDNEGEFFFITKDIKNEKVGNPSDKELAYGWVVVKGIREEPRRAVQPPVVDFRTEKRTDIDKDKTKEQEDGQKAKMHLEDQQNNFQKAESIFTKDEASVVREGEQIRLRLTGLYFSFGKAIIEPQYFSLLTKLQHMINLFPNHHITIEGHTDFIGNDKENQILSLKRAQTFKSYLRANMGRADSQISTVGYGESRPLDTNTTPFGCA